MTLYVLRRLASIVVVLVLISIIIFVLLLGLLITALDFILQGVLIKGIPSLLTGGR